MSNNEIQKLLSFDPVAEAEKHGAGLNKYDFGLLVLSLQIQKSEAIKMALAANLDTSYGSTLKEYIAVAESLGFKKIYEKEFTREYLSGEKGDKQTDFRFIFYQEEDGIVLIFDSWQKKSVNGGYFYYNWQPNNRKQNNFSVTSSGSYYLHNLDRYSPNFDKEFNEKPPIWLGHHDCRQGLRYHIQQLKNKGTFLKKWVEWDMCWFFFEKSEHKPHSREHYLYILDKDMEVWESLPQVFKDNFGEVFLQSINRRRNR